MNRLIGRGVPRGDGTGAVEGEALVSPADLPLSGVSFELATGRVTWPGHPLSGESIQGKILVLPGVKAFAGGDWALYAMSTLHGSGPLAIVAGGTDVFLSAGCLLGGIPLVDSVPVAHLSRVRTGERLRIDAAKGWATPVARNEEISFEHETGGATRGRALSPPRLDDTDERILAGAEGEAARASLELLIRFAAALGARRMLPVQSVHVAGSGYNTTGDATLAFIEQLAASGATTRVPATLNPIALDLERWEHTQRLPGDLALKQRRMNDAFTGMGFLPSYSCAPYWSSAAPRYGDTVAWGEHNAASYANSVIGARTNFESHMVTILAAVTGRIPEHGLYLTRGRRPRVIVEVEAKIVDAVDWRCLGVAVATRIGDRIPLLSGLPRDASTRHLRDLCSALGPPWSRVAMVHVEGVTPEARTRRLAFGGRVPKDIETLIIAERALDEARELVSTATTDRVDLVALGCPQYSAEEIAQVTRAIAGKRVHPDVQLWIWTNRANRVVAEQAGHLEIIERAGGHVIADTCGCAACPVHRSGFRFQTLATDSTKSCGFVSRTGITTRLGSMTECVAAAVSGRWIEEKGDMLNFHKDGN